MTPWRSLWREINTPSSFDDDPYGELTNQSGHAFMGVVLGAAFCIAYREIWGEMPYKEVAGAVVTLPYLLNELFEQRWRGLDTLADVFFYSIGGYGVLASLDEVAIECGTALQPNWLGFVLCLGAFLCAMYVRLKPRVIARYGV